LYDGGVNRRHFHLLAPLLLLAGCSSVSLWPFGDGETRENSRKPANATEYRCDGGRAFYVRNLDGGAVWLIAPDREIRLEKQAEGRYGVGRVLLEIAGEAATLTDPPAQFSNCKRAA
jgi:hypothetical protein